MRSTLIFVLILALAQGGFCAEPGANSPAAMAPTGAQAAKKQGTKVKAQNAKKSATAKKKPAAKKKPVAKKPAVKKKKPVATKAKKGAKPKVNQAPPPALGDTQLPTPAPRLASPMITVEGGTLPQGADQSISTFQIGKYEVTWDEWRTVRAWAVNNGFNMNTGNGSFGNHPVTHVSWYDVVKWCNARSEAEGLVPVYSVNGTVYRTGEFGMFGSAVVVRNMAANGYRLPTEDEWEWAALGGVLSQNYTYSGSNDISLVAWFLDNSIGAAENQFDGRGTWPVGQKVPNELGLHDMSGNVMEWCEDYVEEESINGRPSRGGAFFTGEDVCRVTTATYSAFVHETWPGNGFRIARNFQIPPGPTP
jgi:formylglycine-generating enzyme required for sulfatase activity